jgi:hypothetical protein
VLWLLWGPLVCLTVVATANHYVFDIAAGLAAALAGHGVGVVVRRARERGPLAGEMLVLRPESA